MEHKSHESIHELAETVNSLIGQFASTHSYFRTCVITAFQQSYSIECVFSIDECIIDYNMDFEQTVWLRSASLANACTLKKNRLSIFKQIINVFVLQSQG